MTDPSNQLTVASPDALFSLGITWQTDDLVVVGTTSNVVPIPTLNVIMAVGDELDISMTAGAVPGPAYEPFIGGYLELSNPWTANFSVTQTAGLPGSFSADPSSDTYYVIKNLPPNQTADVSLVAETPSTQFGFIEIEYESTQASIAITVVVPELFTSGDDIVDFRSNLTPSQALAVFRNTNIYADTTTGTDVIFLPNQADYAALHWDSNRTFLVDNGNDTINGGDGSYNIQLGGGTDTVNLTGNGTSTITLGKGTDHVNVQGSGIDTITGTDGNCSIFYSGSGQDTIHITGSDAKTSLFASGGTHNVTLGDGSATIEVTGGGAMVTITGTGGNGNAVVLDGGAIAATSSNGGLDIGGLAVPQLGLVQIDANGAIFGFGTLANIPAIIGIDPKTFAPIFALGTIQNDGVIEASGGTLVIKGNLSGAGSATIDANSTLELSGSDGQAITFAGTNATLQIDSDDPNSVPTNVIRGFLKGDSIHLSNVPYDANGSAILQSFAGQPTVLTISENNKSYNLKFDTSQFPAGAQFELTDDTHGGTNVTMVVDAPLSASPAIVIATEGVSTGNVAVATFTDADPNARATDYTATIDRSDGTSFTGDSSTGTIVSLGGGDFIVYDTHTYADEGAYTVDVTITDEGGRTDKGGSTASATGLVTVQEGDLLTPQSKVLAVSPGQAFVGTVATFTDSYTGNTATDFTATIDWGDGTTPTQGQVSIDNAGLISVSGSHTYLAPGVRPVTVTLSEDAPGTATATADSTANIVNSGHVVKGYISGATIFADANGNGQLDAGELTTSTDSTGSFSLTGGSGPLVAFGGTDTSTGLPFKGQLSAPAGSTDITPLTTLLTDLASDSLAQPKILSTLGLPSSLDLTTFDPIAAAQGGSSDGAATEVAGAKVYDTVEMIASALAGAGGSFTPSLGAAFSSLASALDGTGVNLSDKTALSALITQVAQTESVTLGQGVADTIASMIAAGNAGLDHILQTDQAGSQLLSDVASIELVEQGAASTALAGAGGNLPELQALAHLFTGTNLSELISQGLTASPNNISGTEGAAINTTVATFADANPNAALGDFSATINWGDGTTTIGTVVAQTGGGFAVNGGHTYADEGNFQVGVTINDIGGSTSAATSTAAIADAPLTATPGSISGTEGTAISATVATFTDGNPNALPSDFTAMINWGDGTTTTGAVMAQTGGGFAVQGGHTYAEEGNYQVGVTINDVGGSTASTIGTVGVADADILSGQSLNIAATVNQALNNVAIAKFTDTYAGSKVGDFTANINWGDGSTSTGLVSGGNGAFTVSGSHTYIAAGQDSVTVTLAELAPGNAVATTVSTINVSGVHAQPPVIVSDGGGDTASIIITDGTKFVDVVHATDPNPNTSITYSIAGGTNQKLFKIDPKSGALSFISDPVDDKTYQVKVAASDGTSQDVQTINVKVAEGVFESSNSGTADTFVFKPHFGLAVVNGFDPASSRHDVIELDHSLFHGATAGETGSAALELIADHSFQLGHDLFIFTDSRDVIDLKGTNIHNLTSHDFIIT